MMKYHYAASTMGQFGQAKWWHRFFNFPDFTRTSKTFTYYPKIGTPFLIAHLGQSIWNRVGLRNPGICQLFLCNPNLEKKFTISIAGSTDELYLILDYMRFRMLFQYVDGIEFNFSCPNIKSYNNNEIPEVEGIPLYLKLNYLQDPSKINGIERIKRIRVNSVPTFFGGVSGRLAQKYNWPYIEHLIKEGFDISGCSAYSENDLKRLEDMGCKEISIGSMMLTNPWLVEKLDK